MWLGCDGRFVKGEEAALRWSAGEEHSGVGGQRQEVTGQRGEARLLQGQAAVGAVASPPSASLWPLLLPCPAEALRLRRPTLRSFLSPLVPSATPPATSSDAAIAADAELSRE